MGQELNNYKFEKKIFNFSPDSICFFHLLDWLREKGKQKGKERTELEPSIPQQNLLLKSF